ncbi:MAG: ribosome biogenesis GTP-binding protein YihA/YsxC [Bacillota bacterium]|nr:ribosome biogenesis GTP-binding protein YihA/YsxC [Bacillota bacterium]
MTIKNVELAAVAVKKEQYPPADLPEVAFAGRSNVGKSSLINLLMNRRNLARTSGSPGKTRTINFYEVNGSFRIVDLPGYGYAGVSKAEKAGWGSMIEAYLGGRPNLKRVVLLADIRHEPTEQDVQMYRWICHYGMGGLVVATKADKLSRSQGQKSLALIRRSLEMEEGDLLLPVSALKRTGWETLMEELERVLGTEAPQTGQAGKGEK